MRVFGKVCAMALLALTAACSGSDDGVNEPVSIAGTYVLETIDGQGLPVVIAEDAEFKIEITSGRVVLAAGGSFTLSATLRETTGAEVFTETVEFDGTYSVSGSTVTLLYSDGDVETATISGNTLTFSGGGSTSVFRK